MVVGLKQVGEIAGVYGRAAPAGADCFICRRGFLNALLAVAAGTVALACQFWLLEQWVRPELSGSALPSEEFRKEILANVKRQAPMTIYFCLQGQIGIWLISIFGNVRRVAEVGALGRIGIIFAILVSTTSAIIIPRFARCQDAARLRSRYTLILLGFASIILLGTAFSWLAPGGLLWLRVAVFPVRRFGMVGRARSRNHSLGRCALFLKLEVGLDTTRCRSHSSRNPFSSDSLLLLRYFLGARHLIDWHICAYCARFGKPCCCLSQTQFNRLTAL